MKRAGLQQRHKHWRSGTDASQTKEYFSGSDAGKCGAHHCVCVCVCERERENVCECVCERECV